MQRKTPVPYTTPSLIAAEAQQLQPDFQETQLQTNRITLAQIAEDGVPVSDVPPWLVALESLFRS